MSWTLRHKKDKKCITYIYAYKCNEMGVDPSRCGGASVYEVDCLTASIPRPIGQ